MKVNPLPRTKYFILDLYQYNCTHLFRLEPSYLGVMAAANDNAFDCRCRFLHVSHPEERRQPLVPSVILRYMEKYLD